MTIEEQPDGTLLETPGALLLADGEAHGDAAHVADLKIEQYEIRVAGLDDRQNVCSRADPKNFTIIAGQCGVDFSRNGVGIGG